MSKTKKKSPPSMVNIKKSKTFSAKENFHASLVRLERWIGSGGF